MSAIPRETNHQKQLLIGIFGLLSCVVPLLLGYDIYYQFRFPTLDFFLSDHDTAVVAEVLPGGKADIAGLRAGDIILTVDGVSAATWHTLKLNQTHILEIQRNNQRLVLAINAVSAGQINRLPLFVSTIVVLTFWGAGILLLQRRIHQKSVQVFFLLSQTTAIAILPLLAHPHNLFLPRWMIDLSIACFHLIAPLLLHHTISFPVLLGTPRQRQWGLFLLYGLAVAAVFAGLSATFWGWMTSAFYTLLVVITAVIILVYVYFRRATPDDRRRLRVIVLGTTLAAIPVVLLYFIPSITKTSPWIPAWLMGLFLTLIPLSYLYATARYNLFGIDRLLNRALVYTLLSLVIFLLYLGPFLLLYRLLPGDLLTQTIVVAGLTLLVGLSFNWARMHVQRGVDHLFYGGWYDYPGVVETISDALARSIERVQLVDVLTNQVPSLMQLHEGQLWIGEPGANPPAKSLPSQLPFPLTFQDSVRGLWIVQPRRDGEDFADADRRILKTIARQAEVALSNVLLVETLRSQLQEIRASRKTLAQTQHRLLRSREEERARLARDLHDGPIQLLVGLNIQLGLMMTPVAPPPGNPADPSLAEAVQDMRAEVKELLTDLRHICAELRPPMLDTLGLGAALRALAEEWSAQHQVAVHLDLLPNAHLRSLPGEVSVNLFRVVQEALNNVAHHALARQVTLSLTWEADSLVLTVQDDGQGFVFPERSYELAAQGHFGLVGMQERVELIGGKLIINSAPGQGTAVHVVWPMKD